MSVTVDVHLLAGAPANAPGVRPLVPDTQFNRRVFAYVPDKITIFFNTTPVP